MENFAPIMRMHIADLIQADVAYAEIMVQGSAIPKGVAHQISAFRDFRQVIDKASQGRIQIELLIAMGRDHTPEHITAQADDVIRLFEAGMICGVALAGPEAGFPVKPLSRTFKRLKEAGLGIEIHAGEWVGAESVWDAIEYGFPDRIGHGIAAFDDPDLIALVQDENIHLEFCPTSNLILTDLASIEDHPIRRAMDMGMNFSINTDDPGPLKCSMSSEFDLLRQSLNFTDLEFEAVFQNSRDAAFCKNPGG